MLPPPPRSTLFPYTTLFRSIELGLASPGIGAAASRPKTQWVHMREGSTTRDALDRKSTRLNSSHLGISYAVFCLKKKKKIKNNNEITKENTRNDKVKENTQQ